MAELRDIVEKVRSKNAGPFWLTVDLFCGSPEAYAAVSDRLQTVAVARALNVEPQLVKRFDIPQLHVVKFSLPRPQIQGAVEDRDLHGASWASLIGEIEV